MDDIKKRFHQWYFHLYPSLVRYVRRRWPILEVDDVTQEVALAAYLHWTDKGLGAFPSFDGFRSWCFMRARWLALDALKATSRHRLLRPGRKEVNLHEGVSALAFENDGEKPVDIDPELVELILNLIESLPDKQKKVIKMTVNGFTQYEISKELKIKESTVRSNLRHAKKHIKETLKYINVIT